MKQLSVAGEFINRSKKYYKIFILTFLGLFFTFPYFLKAQGQISGRWEGDISIMGTSIGIITNFEVVNDSIAGKIDIPTQGAYNLPLSNITCSGGEVKFVLTTTQGSAEFKGKLFSDSISGEFKQAGIVGGFLLLKKGKTEADTVIKEKPIYNEEEVTFTNGDIVLNGTLTLPPYPGKHPAVVLVTGSGPQNRDEELLGFKPFKIIADYLTKNGIAVLRYDDRGFGKSTGKSVLQSTTEELAGDAIQAVKYLQTRNDINPKQIGLLGHSEGGIIAPISAVKENEIAFIILMAGTGVTGKEIIKEQTRLIQKADNKTDEEIKRITEYLDMLIDAAIKNSDWDTVKDAIKKETIDSYNKMSEEEKKSISDINEFAENIANSRVEQFRSPWMRYFLEFDPKTVLEKVKCPALILFGELDLQVPPLQNEKPIVDALKKANNNDYTVKTFSSANHLFQQATTGSPNEYSKLKKEFVPGFLELIGNWILKRVNLPR